MVADFWPFIHQQKYGQKWWLLFWRQVVKKKTFNRMSSSLLLSFRYICFCAYEKLARCEYIHRLRRIYYAIYHHRQESKRFILSVSMSAFIHTCTQTHNYWARWLFLDNAIVVRGLFVLHNDIEPMNCILPMHTTILYIQRYWVKRTPVCVYILFVRFLRYSCVTNAAITIVVVPAVATAAAAAAVSAHIAFQ